MKIKRIATLRTLRQYERVLLEELLPKHLAKSGCSEQPQEVLSLIRLECHNPFFLCCVLLSEDSEPIGFIVAYVQNTVLGQRLYIDHMYAPNTGMIMRLFGMVKDRLGVDDVTWMTHRNPEAWVKLGKKYGHDLVLHGYVIRTKSPLVVKFGQKED